MEKVLVIVSKAGDGTHTAYCETCPALIGMGNTAGKAIEDLKETLRITKDEIGRASAAFYPDWLDAEYELTMKWDVQDLLEYYSGIVTPTAIGRISGIHPKQIWSYMHGLSKPRRPQVEKIEKALHKLGHELINATF